MTDWTQILDRLEPNQDGEQPVRHRSAVVDAVNANGTVDLDFDGTVIPDVSVLADAFVAVGATVQVAVWRGDMLVLGSAGIHRTPRYYTTTVSGGPTSGTLGLTLATLVIPDQGYDYTVIPSAFWTSIADTAGDLYDFIVRTGTSGTIHGWALIRPFNVNERTNSAITNALPIAVSAGNTLTLTTRVGRAAGSGAVNTAQAGVMSALVIPA